MIVFLITQQIWQNELSFPLFLQRLRCKLVGARGIASLSREANAVGDSGSWEAQNPAPNCLG
jgi:hypothetical protein